MNGKKAKAMRRLAEHITSRKGLPARHEHQVDLGLGNVRVVNAADTTRGQYRALKAVVRAAYRRAAA